VGRIVREWVVSSAVDGVDAVTGGSSISGYVELNEVEGEKGREKRRSLGGERIAIAERIT
jgi:hypothetical protein